MRFLLPKAFKMPEITMYTLQGISSEVAASFLTTSPVTDRTMGIEIRVDPNGVQPYFFIEYHKPELPLQPAVQLPLTPPSQHTSCYTLYPRRGPIFPFQSSFVLWESLRELPISYGYLIIQLLFIKKTNPKLQHRLWTQYEDYVNGIEEPTANRALHLLQNQLLEVMRRIEGGYRKQPRIPESESKLREDLFITEQRVMIFNESSEARQQAALKLQAMYAVTHLVNRWQFKPEKPRSAFIEHMNLRRLSLFQEQYLCASELRSYFVTPSVTPEPQLILPPPEPAAAPAVDTNPFALFPKGSPKKRRDYDQRFAEKLNRALRKLNLISSEDVVIQKVTDGATVREISFTLPDGLKLSRLQQNATHDDIQAELALNNIEFKQGKAAGTATLVIPQQQRDMVFVRDCTDDLEFQRAAKKFDLPVLLGVDEVGDVIVVCLTQIKHLLVSGSTGSGKSVFLNTLLLVLFTLVNPKDLKVYMIDPKMVELKPYADYPHVQKVYTEMEEAEGILAHLCDDMDNRYSDFEGKGYKNIQQHNRNEQKKLPYVVMVIEELADLMETNPEVESYIVRLSQKGRACGMHLIVCTQYPIAKVVTSLIKRNIYSRVCFLLGNNTAYQVALDEAPKHITLLGKGDGLYRFEGLAGIHRFQAPLIAPAEEQADDIIKKMATYWKEPHRKEVVNLKSAKQKKIEQELLDFKKHVLQSGETRVTVLKKHLSVRPEKVTEWLDQLVDLGWMVKHKSRAKGYEWVWSEADRARALQALLQ